MNAGCGHWKVGGDTLFVADDGHLHAYDLEAGKSIWTVEYDSEIVHGKTSSDCEYLTVFGGYVLVCAHTHRNMLHLVDRKTGELKWQVKSAQYNPSLQPLMADSMLILMENVPYDGVFDRKLSDGSTAWKAAAGDQNFWEISGDGHLRLFSSFSTYDGPNKATIRTIDPHTGSQLDEKQVSRSDIDFGREPFHLSGSTYLFLGISTYERKTWAHIKLDLKTGMHKDTLSEKDQLFGNGNEWVRSTWQGQRRQVTGMDGKDCTVLDSTEHVLGFWGGHLYSVSSEQQILTRISPANCAIDRFKLRNQIPDPAHALAGGYLVVTPAGADDSLRVYRVQS